MVRALFGAFVAIETFALLARADRWGVLFFFTKETWLYVLLLWLKDLALAAAAGAGAVWLLALLTRAAARVEDEPPAPLARAAEAAWVVPAVALGGVLRWAFRAWNPPGLWVDAVYAARPLFGGTVPPWGATPFGENPASHEVVSNLYVTFVRAVFALFGSGETGFFAISAVPACLALPAFWWLAREAFGARTAVVAAVLGALLGWPILLGRWTTTAALLLALVLLAAAAALRALRTGRPGAAAFSGSCVGLSLHTHASAGAVAAGFVAFALLAAREKPARRLVVAACAAAVLSFAPLGWAFVAGPARLGGHLRDVRIGTPVKNADGPRAAGALRVPEALAANAIDYGGVLLWTCDPNARHSAGGRVVSPALGAVVLLGIGLAATRRRPADVLLLLVAAGSLLAGILSNPGGAPNTLRVSALAAPAVVLAALALQTGFARAARAGAASWSVLVAGLAAGVLVAETLPALVAFPDQPGVAAAFGAAETEAGRILARLGNAPVVLEAGAVRHPVVVEAVARGANRATPLDRYARRTPDALRAAPPADAFWLVASPRGLADLAAGGFTSGRGIAVGGDASGLLLVRVRPPR